MTVRPTHLTGSFAQGTIQIAETAINELLHQRDGRITVEWLPHNRLIVRAGPLHARAELPSHVGRESLPLITVRLASVLVAWGLKAIVHQPYIHIHGRALTIDLAALPAPAPWRDSWKHLQQLTFETVAGALRVGFAIAIAGDPPAAARSGAEESGAGHAGMD